jgi:phage gp36-like protein
MYATVDDMTTRFETSELVQLSDHEGLGVINQAVVDAALFDASQEIDSYVAAVYTLPLAETPNMLRRYACDIARYYLFKGAAPDRVKTAYDDAVTWLKNLSAGKVRLQITVDSAPVAATSTQNVIFDSATRVNSRDSLAGY